MTTRASKLMPLLTAFCLAVPTVIAAQQLELVPNGRLSRDVQAQARARTAVGNLYAYETGEPVAQMKCGGGPGISPGIQSWYACSHNGTLCYVNITVNNKIASGACTDCGDKDQLSCTPWND